MSTGSQRTVVIVSHDFGEFANAALWRAQAPGETEIWIPARLAVHHDTRDASLRTYTQADEVLASLAASPPSLVLLCSGYLLSAVPPWSLDDLRRLVSVTQTARIPLATTDPFLRLIPDAIDSLFDPAHAAARTLTEHFREVGRTLAQAHHLYLAPLPASHGPRDWAIRPSVDSAFESAATSPAETPSRSWLFVMSQEDLQHIGRSAARDRFALDLVARFREIHAAGGTTQWIAPREGLDLLASHSLGAAHEAIPFCGLAEFRRRLDQAEHVFYWNSLSNSILPRLLHRQSVFFFDRGHMARAMPLLYQRAIDHYFHGHAPEILDLQRPLANEHLAAIHRRQLESLAELRHAMRSLPAARELLQAWTSGD